jgi:regulator of protease activity HflC (stomatin/prohibitin superfamily)
MTTVTHYPLLSHLRAEPNQFILHYRSGKLARRGAGLAYWFSPLSAAIAQLPVEDVETTFVLTERTADYQDVSVQCTLTYRVADAELAASRINFSVSLQNGSWTEEPLARLASFWSQRARRSARTYLTSVPLVDAVGRGADVIRVAMEEALRVDTEIAAMGLTLVSVQVQRVAPTPDMDKALQTPVREAIQQRADEAVFARRAQAVENERAIKQNELSTEIELARRQEDLIRREGANRLLAAQQQSIARQVLIEAEAVATRLSGEAEADAESRRMTVWHAVPARVLLGLAAYELATRFNGLRSIWKRADA